MPALTREEFWQAVRFTDGLLPVVLVDARTKDLLTLAYMDEDALRRTLETGETWLYSRSRRALWHKGETSHNRQKVEALVLDCDGDALAAYVHPLGPACHTGEWSCFHRPLLIRAEGRTEDEGAPFSPSPAGSEAHPEGQWSYPFPPSYLASESMSSEGLTVRDLGFVLERLARVIAARRTEPPEKSYTAYLFREGREKILKKIGEETTEAILAAQAGRKNELAEELADVLYHVSVLLAELEMDFGAVASALHRRLEGARDVKHTRAFPRKG
ncbi:MAG: Phosphoribosyl-AMP cyclohydrolase [Brockia lithotrophica]|uniref:Histidine biosynthesis bifunctional protein HisIE n=1 Tax=Brockia lithotrophica TaxID=933949 RepID=A0A2T5G436_9BACL|nr:MAG: Phosphoribosyl-AMP cyclohydrolase [Brockia lithotrophica]